MDIATQDGTICNLEIEIVMYVKGSVKIECPSRSIGANPCRKQKCCSQLRLVSQTQWVTSD